VDYFTGGVFGGNEEIVLFKRMYVGGNRLANVFDGDFPGLSLTDAAGQARALSNPKTIFASIKEYLPSHRIPS